MLPTASLYLIQLDLEATNDPTFLTRWLGLLEVLSVLFWSPIQKRSVEYLIEP